MFIIEYIWIIISYILCIKCLKGGISSSGSAKRRRRVLQSLFTALISVGLYDLLLVSTITSMFTRKSHFLANLILYVLPLGPVLNPIILTLKKLKIKRWFKQKYSFIMSVVLESNSFFLNLSTY